MAGLLMLHGNMRLAWSYPLEIPGVQAHMAGAQWCAAQRPWKNFWVPLKILVDGNRATL
jgi:hypothetical protein